jgi:surfactin synthase thioesterase subunit
MIRASFTNNRLALHVPGRRNEMGTAHLLTVEQMTELHDSIERAMRDRERFLEGDWAGPDGRLD